MKQILAGTARTVSRRGFLARASAITFGGLAAAAVGRAPEAIAAPCTGPGGTGSCGCACSGRLCSRCPGTQVSCTAYAGCGGGQCWSGGSGMCCDCRCGYGGQYWYCYCTG